MDTYMLFRYFRRTTMILIALLSYQVAAQVGTITQDISTLQDFSLQQQCVQTCFQLNYDFCPVDMLGIELGCASMGCSTKGWQAKNDCYCRPDFQQPAQDYLDGCISKSCTVGDPSVAAESAGSIYRRYCEEKGYDTARPASNEASTTSLSRATSLRGSQALPSATAPSAGGSSNTNSESHGGLSTAALVGIILGAIVAGLLLIGFAWWYRSRIRPTPPPSPRPPQPRYDQHLSTDNVNRLHDLNEPRFGEAASEYGPHAQFLMPISHRPIAGPMSIQSGRTNMSQPFSHLGVR